MELGMVGLGRMGANMTERLVRGGHRVVVYDRDPQVVGRVASSGRSEDGQASIAPSNSLTDLVAKLQAKDQPRVVWIMVPAGPATTGSVRDLIGLLGRGDIIIDGGNSNYKDSIQHAKDAGEAGVQFLDAGTSGGVWGLEEGFNLMVGGPEEAFRAAESVFATLAPSDGYARVGPSGAGHYVKMIHNGIEYGLLQAYGEGFAILHATKQFDLDLKQIAELWRHGSVVRSWLLDLAALAFDHSGNNLDHIKGWVADSGEGRWTVQTAIDLDVPAEIITLSLLDRFRSRLDESFSDKVIAALRNEFGGHEVRTE